MKGERREFYAETVQNAVDKAASSLGVAPDQVEYEVLDEGSSGFLGIGARDARIAVSVPQLATSPFSESDELSSTSLEEAVEASTEPAVLEDEVHSEESAVSDSGEGVVFPIEEAPADLIVAVDGFATELLEKMGFDATVDAYDAGEVIKVDLTTPETGLLIGQKGETIDAVQYLLNVAVYKNRPFLKKITVDTEGYRQRRIEALQGMAHRTARRAQREKRALDLPPMAAAERRVVHLYLKENPNVSTSSKGGEDDRRVIITPND